MAVWPTAGSKPENVRRRIRAARCDISTPALTNGTTALIYFKTDTGATSLIFQKSTIEFSLIPGLSGLCVLCGWMFFLLSRSFHNSANRLDHHIRSISSHGVTATGCHEKSRIRGKSCQLLLQLLPALLARVCSRLIAPPIRIARDHHQRQITQRSQLSHLLCARWKHRPLFIVRAKHPRPAGESPLHGTGLFRSLGAPSAPAW